MQPQPGTQLGLAFHSISPRLVSFYWGIMASHNTCYIGYEGHWQSGNMFQDIHANGMRFENFWWYTFGELRLCLPKKNWEFGGGINAGLSLKRSGYYSYDMLFRQDPNTPDTSHVFIERQPFGGKGGLAFTVSATHSWIKNDFPIRLGLRGGMGLTQHNFEMRAYMMNKVVLVMRESFVELNFSTRISRSPKATL